MSPSCDQLLASPTDQMITEHQLVAILMPHYLFADSCNKRPSVMMTSIRTQRSTNQLFPPLAPLLLFQWSFQKGLQFSKK